MVESAQRVLVTGAGGFVGGRAVARLRQEGYTVRALVRPDSRRPVAEAERLEVATGDIRNAAAVTEAARGCAAAVHLVGIIRERPRQTFFDVHVTGTETLVAACRAAGVRRLVHASALGVGRGTETPYFRTKEAAETSVRESGLDWTILRPAVIHGPHGDFMIQMARRVARLGPVPLVGRGLQVLQPIWVEDVARLVAEALRREATIAHVYEVGGPDILTLRAFYRKLARILLGRPKRVLPVPRLLVRAGAWGAARVMADPPVTPDELRMLEAARPCDIAAVTEAFGFPPARFEDTVAAYADDLRKAAGIPSPATEA